MDSKLKKEYSNGELTVVWEPKKCIHAAVCVSMLPNVYKPKEKPWVQVEHASTEELKDQISKCPSGALSYYMNSDTKETNALSTAKVDVMENGPLLVSGNLIVKTVEGNVESKENVTAFCRCGHSNNKPYCDGMHNKAGFKG